MSDSGCSSLLFWVIQICSPAFSNTLTDAPVLGWTKKQCREAFKACLRTKNVAFSLVVPAPTWWSDSNRPPCGCAIAAGEKLVPMQYAISCYFLRVSDDWEVPSLTTWPVQILFARPNPKKNTKLKKKSSFAFFWNSADGDHWVRVLDDSRTLKFYNRPSPVGLILGLLWNAGCIRICSNLLLIVLCSAIAWLIINLRSIHTNLQLMEKRWGKNVT